MRFYSKPIEEHGEVPLADQGRLESLVSQWMERETRASAHDSCNLSYVVCVDCESDRRAVGAQLEEILGLVCAQGDELAGYETIRLKELEPKTFIGRGRSLEIAERAKACGANMLVIDAELSPSQTRNLEEVTGFAVCDREAVILNVFSRHARTRKSRIQVEIAHLEYLRPRIRGLGLIMDQQAGGVMGGRGPGETATELLARQLDRRLTELRKAFTKLQRAADVQRRGRQQCERIVLVGYTNAGKTTLMNGLTAAGLSARNLPFETLDTTSRCLTRHGRTILVSDTVGFIRRLPDRLLASFESTLAEVRDASLLALVVDLSDPEYQLHLETTEKLLSRLAADTLPRFYIFNKMDRVLRVPTNKALERLASGHEWMIVSGQDSEAVARLKAALVNSVRNFGLQQAQVFVPYEATQALAEVYGKCRVLEVESSEKGLHFTLQGENHILERLKFAMLQV